jgi:hypothetical protein
MGDLPSLSNLSLRQGRSLVYGNRYCAAPDVEKEGNGKNVHQWTAFVEEKGEWGEGEGIHKVDDHFFPILNN